MTTRTPYILASGIIFACLLLTHASADVEVLHGRVHGHIYKVRLESRPFRRKGHRITRGTQGEYLLDGKTFIGEGVAGTHLPDTELSAFDVLVDGKRWHVPSRLWRDCYDPNLDEAHPSNASRYVHVRLSRDGKRMVVDMAGSDGTGSYTVIWHLRPNGRDSRKLEDQ